MKELRRAVALSLAASMLLASACTSNTGVETTTSDTVIAIDSVALDSAVVEAVGGTEEVAETTEFDITEYDFDTLYGSQFPAFINHQYTFGGENVPLAETNFYLINTFIEFNRYAQYGYYPVTAEGYFDLSAPIETEEDISYANYGEFLVDYTENIIHSTCIICDMAREEGIELDDETLAEIDAMVAELEETQATPQGISIEEYIALFYGENCTLDDFKAVLYNYYLANYYTQLYVESFDGYTEEDYESLNPTVRYALYLAPADTATEEELAAAEAMANEVFNSCNGDIEAFATIGQESYEAGDSLEYGELIVIPGRFVPGFEAWALSEDRQDGDLDVIYCEEYGYFVVGYVGKIMDEDTAQGIAVSTLGDYVTSLFDNAEYALAVTEPYAPAEPVESLETNPIVDDGFVSTEGTTALLGASTEEGNTSATSVLMIILASVGGAAIVILAGVGLASIVKNAKKSKKNDDDAGDDDESFHVDYKD